MKSLECSSEEGEDDKKRGIEVGANAYLVKPFRSDSFLAEVYKFLN